MKNSHLLVITMHGVGMIIPQYNELSKSRKCFMERLDYFAELAQDNPHLRIVLIDDGSTDGSGDAIRSYVDSHNPRFSAIYRTHNGQKIGAIKDGVRSLDPNVDTVFLTDFDTSLSEESAHMLPSMADKLYDKGAGMAAVRVTPKRKNFLTTLQGYDYLIGRGTQVPLRRERKIRCVSGAGGLWKRSVVEEVLPLHTGSHASDDFLLTTLAQKNGYSTEYFHDIIAETEAPTKYRDLIRQRKRWDMGAFETYEKEFGFFLKEIPKIVKGRLYGPLATVEWASWLMTPFSTYIASTSVTSNNYKWLLSYYLTDLAVSGALMFLRRKEIEKKGEAVAILPIMPFYRAGIYYPARVWAVGSHLKDKIRSAVSYFSNRKQNYQEV